ncbi:MAG: L,D-transpeptidase, partial [Aquificae bacterium]|nr:L,D-transpeptidase [Aquificota bacterium]
DFDPYINIFPIVKGNLFGLNEVYISKRNQTLVEIAKILDMGYDELRIANKYINPHDIRKGEAIFVPRKRLIPEENFKFNHIYINLSEKRLYYPVKIENKPYVITIPVGIGTDENQSPVGDFKITEKRKNPEWRVPKSIREEDPSLPEVVPPGPNNPLGTRAMRLGNTSFLMHGTSKKFGIGMKVSHGCIRMYNKDVERLFEVVPRGTPVHILEKDFKIYQDEEDFLIEVFYFDDKDREYVLQNHPEVKEEILNYTKEERKGFAAPLKDKSAPSKKEEADF